jgi:type I restriction enzyme S subunit
VELTKAFRKTDVGLIPEDWSVVTALDACSKIQDGTHFSPSRGGDDYLYVTSKNIRLGYLDVSTAGRIDTASHRAIYRRCAVQKGDLLLTKDGANTGNAALNTLDEEISLLSSVAFLRPHKSKYSAAFLLQQILTEPGQRQIKNAMAGNAITRLTLEKIKKLRFPVPPIKAEQEAIAEALGDADALIASLEQLIAKKRYIKQGAMQELLTGAKRLPGFSGAWEAKRLSEIAHIKTGSRNNQDKVEDGEYPFFVRSANVERINSFSYDCEAILVPGEGGIGSIFHYIDGRFEVHQRVYAITNFDRGVSSKFVFFFMAEHFGAHAMQNSVKVTVDSLRLPTFQNFELRMPPTKAEQISVAAILSDMEVEIAELEAQLLKTRDVKQGMMQELLTGRIRLV